MAKGSGNTRNTADMTSASNNASVVDTNEVNQKVEQIGKEIVSFRDYTLKSIGENTMREDKVYQVEYKGKTLFASLSFDKALGFMKGYLTAKQISCNEI